jgi:hypothetical protein
MPNNKAATIRRMYFFISQYLFHAIVRTYFGNSSAIKDAAKHPRNQGGSREAGK